MMENLVLVTLRPYIEEDVSYKHVSGHLIRKGILSKEEDTKIDNLIGKAKTKRLMDLIITREGALEEFIYALRMPICYSLYKNLILKLEYTQKRSLSSVSCENGEQSTNCNGNANHKEPTLKSGTANTTVEKRHFNDLVKILKSGSTKQWKDLYEALGIELYEMFSTSQKLSKGEIDTAEAYRDVIETWRENNGKKATFGVLEDALRNKLQWVKAAVEISEHKWN